MKNNLLINILSILISLSNVDRAVADSTVISISSDDSLIYVGTTQKNDSTESNDSYSADRSKDSSYTDSSWSFETPSDLDEKLKLLYSGQGSAFLHEQPVNTSTPKRKDNNKN